MNGWLMNPRITNVQADNNFKLILSFTNGEIREFDMTPYLKIGVFRELQDEAKFKAVKPFLGSIQWVNGQDLCPDTLYLESKTIEKVCD